MIIFDVGANDGAPFLELAAADPEKIVYAFEPTPQLVARLREQSQHLGNYLVVPKAVSNFSGRTVFNVSGVDDWGCSSLHRFNENLEKSWPGRTDFKVTEVIEVEVITLGDFISEHRIAEIDYLHVDVQGDDLNVLKGLGKKLSIVKKGDVEAASSAEVALYQGQHTLADVRQFLDEQGFEIERVEPNDDLKNEVVVFFKRR